MSAYCCKCKYQNVDVMCADCNTKEIAILYARIGELEKTLKEVVLSLADRAAKQSDLLSSVAEKATRVDLATAIFGGKR